MTTPPPPHDPVDEPSVAAPDPVPDPAAPRVTVAEEQAPAAPRAAPSRSGRPARSRPPWSVVAVALALALAGLATAAVALLAGAGGGSAAGERSERSADRRAEALEAARTRTARLTSYDHATLDADYAEVLSTATGPFKADYEKTSEQLRPTFLETQAVAKGKVLAAGLEEFGRRRAVAVVAVDQVIETSGAPPRTERNRLRMVLVRPADEWLVERVERL